MWGSMNRGEKIIGEGWVGFREFRKLKKDRNRILKMDEKKEVLDQRRRWHGKNIKRENAGLEGLEGAEGYGEK